jgi:hypothetical protein
VRQQFGSIGRLAVLLISAKLAADRKLSSISYSRLVNVPSG